MGASSTAVQLQVAHSRHARHDAAAAAEYNNKKSDTTAAATLDCSVVNTPEEWGLRAQLFSFRSPTAGTPGMMLQQQQH
jgi:hypothetical protein